MAVVDTVRTTLGPRGMDKLIVDEKGELDESGTPRSLIRVESNLTYLSSLGDVTISNDGATIMKLLDVVHPAAKTLVDIARSQDAEVSRLGRLICVYNFFAFFGSFAIIQPLFICQRLEMGQRPWCYWQESC